MVVPGDAHEYPAGGVQVLTVQLAVVGFVSVIVLVPSNA
ncbi:MAG: hypothetical protein RL018_1973, partial [Pseudomonadota bacterium]